MENDLPALATALTGTVETDPAALEQARSDRSGHRSPAPARAVVRAADEQDVRTALRWAHEHRVPVVPRGAGTGLAGGAVAGAGELSLDLSAMRRILEISEEDQLAVVEPGIVNADLNAALAERGLWWAPDPASRALSTVGGNIATNAGGLLCAKYGVTREAVLGLGVVLPGGERIDVGHRTVKGVTGLDLTALMIGSEGTLGVIVEATLRLRPAPTQRVWTLGAFFDDEVAAARACSEVTAARMQPSIMELVGPETVSMLAAYTGEDLRGTFVLLQFDDAAAERVAASAQSLLREHGGRTELTDDPSRSDLLVQVRRQVHFALESFGTVLVEDVAVPRSRMAEMFSLCREAGRRHGVTVATTAHAGDGNLHPTFVMDAPEPDAAVWAAADEIFRGALSLGGTLTGEHGVGLLKRRWLGEELGEAQLRLQQQIKRAFDPRGILNPGKVFAP